MYRIDLQERSLNDIANNSKTDNQSMLCLWVDLNDSNCQMLSFGGGARDIHLASSEPLGSLGS